MTKIHFQDKEGIAIEAQQFGELAGVDSLYQSVLVREGVHYGFSYKVAGAEDEYVFQEKVVIEVPTSSTAVPMTQLRLMTAIKEYVDDSMEVDASTLVGDKPSGADCFFRWGNDSFQVVVFQSTRSGMDIIERSRS